MTDKDLPAKPLKFTISDKISTIKRKFFKVCCRCYKPKTFESLYSDNQKTYLKAYDLYRDQFNLYKMAQTVHKLKACV